MFKIHCLLTTGGQLDDVMRNKLYQVARDMLTTGDKLRRFKTKYMEGQVTTEYTYGMMGYIGGTVCEAEFEANVSVQKQTVRFIMMKPFLDDRHMENCRWGTREEMLEAMAEVMEKNPYFQQAMNAHNN